VNSWSPILALLGDEWFAWIAALLFAAIVLATYALSFRRRMRTHQAQYEEMSVVGLSRPVGQFPYIDPALCIGCGNCVDVCPEGDVLGLVGGQAVVINGARCVGIANCEVACPVGAIEVGLGEIKGRADLPVLDDQHQTSVPGVYIAGELGGLSLVRNAIFQGSRCVREIAEQLRAEGGAAVPRSAAAALADPDRTFDLLIIGSGPAGMSAALTAREQGVDFLVLEQEASLGGTIDHYPRQKIVHTQPVELPLFGWLNKSEQSKEELLELFTSLSAAHDLAIRFGERVAGFERRGDRIVVRATSDEFSCRYLLLAIGRRGTPRKLGVPGEELAKVFYQVRDAEQYQGRRIVCVGGGDSAVEAAMGLSAQPGNEVLLSYRKARFARIKSKNQSRIDQQIRSGRVRALFESNLREIRADQVLIEGPDGPAWIENDLVFVFAGGEPPYPLLREGGVVFGDQLE
jgi:thioredoxin reductase/NAD-dependent dihydropyrimidine dehydrogenase PreA subunit